MASIEPFPDLVDESFDEATFLWQRWESDLTSPTRSLDEVWSWTEDRLHGALDGVRVGGLSAIAAATNALMSDEIERVTVGAAVLASSIDPKATEALVTALKSAGGDRFRAMLRALESIGSDLALRSAATALAHREPIHAGALCRLKAFRRAAPGPEMADALGSGIPEARVDALHAARLAPAGSAEKWIAAALHDGDAAVRHAAVETGMCLRLDESWQAALHLARQRDAAAAPYLNLVALLGTADEHEAVYGALRVPELQATAIWALGHVGSVRAVDACVAGMKHEGVARACGEAYCWMTGADLERDHLAAPEAPADVPAFEDDDLDADLVPPPEALWPLPDPEAVRTHWLTLRGGWAADVRHVQGRPVGPDALLNAIETGPMLRRPDLVRELRVRTGGRYDVEPRAFAWRQRLMMAAGRAAVSGQGGR